MSTLIHYLLHKSYILKLRIMCVGIQTGSQISKMNIMSEGRKERQKSGRQKSGRSKNRISLDFCRSGFLFVQIFLHPDFCSSGFLLVRIFARPDFTVRNFVVRIFIIRIFDRSRISRVRVPLVGQLLFCH